MPNKPARACKEGVYEDLNEWVEQSWKDRMTYTVLSLDVNLCSSDLIKAVPVKHLKWNEQEKAATN